MDAITDALIYIVKGIVDNPDDVIIDTKQEETKTVFIITTNQSDTGKVIGKSGRIIKAIRDLVKLMAVKQNIYADVILAEDLKTEEAG